MSTATYSPDDNKLRLYSVGRLDPETYARVKGAGFSWAPKQELFVAPAWTPDREDLLIELCGEVGDEDLSLVERAEERADRFEDYSDRRRGDADAAHAAVERIADGIPLGQPILVGHHSERHARRDAEKIENGMRKAVKLWETSRYWADRAAGAIRHAKYKELPAVRARRIKGLEADLRKRLRERDGLAARLKFWSKPDITREQALAVCNVHDHGGVLLPDGSKHWSAWSALEDGRVTAEEVRRQRLDSLPSWIAHEERWIAHFENRLAYERAMLGEQGGTVADRNKPEKGGAVRCWASPGYGRGWSYVKRVNKVSVTVEDNWGNGGRNFTRTIEFDELKAVMSKAAVDAARAEGRLHEGMPGIGFYLDEPVESNAEAADRVHREAVAGGGEDAAKFEALKGSLEAGVKVVSAPQLFPTPPELAARVVELAEIGAGHSVLEPSAGTGRLLDALPPDVGRVVAVEINAGLARQLEASRPAADVRCADFLACNGELGLFDRIVMNPPFAGGADIAHVRHALGKLAPGGRLVAIVANGPRQREKLMPEAEEWVDLPAGSFESSGTGVHAAIAVFARWGLS
jgi:protein-L-isoaspartate O-methyltransferase